MPTALGLAGVFAVVGLCTALPRPQRRTALSLRVAKRAPPRFMVLLGTPAQRLVCSAARTAVLMAAFVFLEHAKSQPHLCLKSAANSRTSE